MGVAMGVGIHNSVDMATQPATKVSEEEYLRRERAAERKSEFVDSEIRAMAGGSLRHSKMAVSLGARLEAQLADRDCSVFSSDTSIRTSLTGSYVYPDLSIVCGRPERHNGDSTILTNPVAVVEVLSVSTTKYDRGKKFDLYSEIPRLMDYLLVHTSSPHVEHFVRQPDNRWLFREYVGLESSIAINSIGCCVGLDEIYAKVLALPE